MSDRQATTSVGTLEVLMQAAVEHAQATLHADVGFAAAASSTSEYRISQTVGVTDPRWNSIVVRPGLGLGGLVLSSRQASIAYDYANDRRISRHFVDIVSGGEGLQAVACVPILGPLTTDALLYVGTRNHQSMGQRALDALQQIASFVAIGVEQERSRSLQLELERLRERERLASSLHDSVAQRLFAIGALVTSLRHESNVDNLHKAVSEIEVTAADARRELRETLLHLNQDTEHLSFHLQLDGELRLLQTTTGCSIQVRRSGASRQLPEHIERLLIDTAVEGVRNAIKHSSARSTTVEISYEQRHVCLAVVSKCAARHDDNHDFTERESTASTANGTGIGLRALRARAERLGGTLTLESSHSNSGVLLLVLPLCARTQ